MRETRPSGLEGGAARSTCRSYPYLFAPKGRMVRGAGFEPADKPIENVGPSGMTHEMTSQMCEIMALWRRLKKPVRESILTLIRAQTENAI